jgi:DNA topoisomerase-1
MATSRTAMPVALPEVVVRPQAAAKAAALCYVTDKGPGGIRRRRAGKGFVYYDPAGRKITDSDVLRRIRALAIPPAWTDVWICAKSNGHLQASGRDAKGRKQYRYHSRWRQIRDDGKYTKMLAFARALPDIRAQVDRDLALSGLPRKRVIATVVRLLETTLIRVGNEEYARENNSFGLTTMRDRHVRVSGSSLHFQFRGKAGKVHTVRLTDRRLARIVKRCQELPGQELFQYVDDNGAQQTVDSADVNEYLREAAGEEFTAKDFRTWAGTVLAALALDELRQFDSQAQAKRNVVRAVEQVARLLGNTPAICRKCYVHPAIFDAYQDGLMLDRVGRPAVARLETGRAMTRHGLRPEEAAVLALLEERLSREVGEQRRIA